MTATALIPQTDKAPASRRTIPFGRPMIGDEERQAVLEVLSGPTLTHGPRVKQFEADFAKFTGAPFALAVSSATAALHLAYWLAGVGHDDEVIVPVQTHVATAHAVELCGGRCVFLDSEPRTGNVNIDLIEDLITPRTKAIAVVHYLGLPVEMDRVIAIAKRHKLMVVEDCALSLGATHHSTHTGLIGDVGCFSFYPAKHMTTAEGGMLITKHEHLFRKAAMQRAFGIDRNIVADRVVPGQYDVELLGNNYRMSEIGAAIGIEQLKRVPGFLAARRANFQRLASGLAGIPELQPPAFSQGKLISSAYCYQLLLKDPISRRRSDIVARLTEQGVGVSVYYPRPVCEMSYYRRRYGTTHETCPVASNISRASIALPVGPHLSGDDVDWIIAAVKKALACVR